MRYLREQGMEVLDRNWRCEIGEVDIVARDGDCLVICEVKTRRTLGFGEPVEAVTFAKAMRLRQLAAAYLAGHTATGRGWRRCGSTSSASSACPGGRPCCGTSWGSGREPGARSHPVGGAVRARRHAGRRRGAHRAGAAALRDRRDAGCRVRAGARPGAVRGRDQRRRRCRRTGSPSTSRRRRSRSAEPCFDLPIAVAVLSAAGVIRGRLGPRGRPPRRAGPRRAGAWRARRAARGARGSARGGRATWSCRSRTSVRPSSSTA